MISQTDIAKVFNKMTTLTDGDITLKFFTPYTRRCCEIRKAGVLIGTRYTVKTAHALYIKTHQTEQTTVQAQPETTTATTEAAEQTEMTVVIFRKWPKSEGSGILALFPYEPGANDPYTCSSYQHIGQHSSADDRGCVQRTTLATPEEYAALKLELESAPYFYRLDVRKRIPSDAIEVRRRKLSR